MKENVHLSLTADFRTVLDREAVTHLRCGQTADHREGRRRLPGEARAALPGPVSGMHIRQIALVAGSSRRWSRT